MSPTVASPPHRLRMRTWAWLVVLTAGWSPLEAKLKIVTTTTDLASIAQEITQDLADVTAIAKGFQDPHFVDPKPSFLVQLQRADMFVMVGMDLERAWAFDLLTNSRNAKIQPAGPGHVDASVGIARLQVPTAADRTMGDIHAFGNPHYWLDPANGAIIAGNITAGLQRIDPANASTYQKNLDAFTAKLEDAVARWTRQAAPLVGLPVVVYHDSWPYFVQRFGLDVVAFVEPKPGIPPSGRYIAELSETMKTRHIGVLVMTSFYDDKTAQLISRQSGAKEVTLAQSVGGVPAALDYFSLFDNNLALLLDAAGK